MLRSKRLQEESGRNPLFEQTIAAASRKPRPGDELVVIEAEYSNIPPALPGKDHHSGHATHKNWKESDGYTEYGRVSRFMVPPPQRAKSDDPNRAYTKSPDYVKNYGKTKRHEHPSMTDYARAEAEPEPMEARLV